MIDHYEIESRRPGAGWEHVGNKYPDYKWKICRPWYYLGLIRCPRIINREAALKQAGCDLISQLAHPLAEAWNDGTKEHIRITLWCRGFFGRLWKVKMLEA
jgi:hypothetical protein